MLTYDAALEVAKLEAKKSRVPHGVFQISSPRPHLARNHEDCFSRKLDGTPPANAVLVAQCWPNGAEIKGGGV